MSLTGHRHLDTGTMACWSFKASRELEEMHRSYEDIAAKNLELTTNYKKLEQEREGMKLQCEAKQLEVQELTRKLREASALESRLQAALERSQADIVEQQSQLQASAKQLEEANKETKSFRQDNEMLLKKVDKLGKEKTYLQQRCDRMTQALAMLEDVLDETLTEPRNTAARMDTLRQSKTAVQMLLEDPRAATASFEPHNNPMFEGRVKLAHAEPKSAGGSASRYQHTGGMSPRSPVGSPRKSGPLAAAGQAPGRPLDAADVQMVLKDQKV